MFLVWYVNAQNFNYQQNKKKKKNFKKPETQPSNQIEHGQILRKKMYEKKFQECTIYRLQSHEQL